MFEAMQAGAGAGELCTTPTPSRSYPRADATRSQRGERGRLDLRRGIGSGPLDVGVGRVSSRAAAPRMASHQPRAR